MSLNDQQPREGPFTKNSPFITHVLSVIIMKQMSSMVCRSSYGKFRTWNKPLRSTKCILTNNTWVLSRVESERRRQITGPLEVWWNTTARENWTNKL